MLAPLGPHGPSRIRNVGAPSVSGATGSPGAASTRWVVHRLTLPESCSADAGTRQRGECTNSRQWRQQKPHPALPHLRSVATEARRTSMRERSNRHERGPPRHRRPRVGVKVHGLLEVFAGSIQESRGVGLRQAGGLLTSRFAHTSQREWKDPSCPAHRACPQTAGVLWCRCVATAVSGRHTCVRIALRP